MSAASGSDKVVAQLAERLASANVAFDYRIVAKRLGYESKRLVDMRPMLEKLKSGLPKRAAATTKAVVDGK